MPIDPARFEQFFRRNSSGDWVYVGYGPDIVGKVVSSHDREWLLEALPRLSAMKRWTVALFSAPLVWLFAVFLNVVIMLPGTLYTRWLFRHREEIGLVAVALLAAFLLSTALLTMHPTAREFGRLIAKRPKDEPIGVEKYLRNVGAVNGALITAFLFFGFGALVVPGVFNEDMWPYFLPFSVVWVWTTWHALAGAFWRPRDEDF